MDEDPADAKQLVSQGIKMTACSINPWGLTTHVQASNHSKRKRGACFCLGALSQQIVETWNVCILSKVGKMYKSRIKFHCFYLLLLIRSLYCCIFILKSSNTWIFISERVCVLVWVNAWELYYGSVLYQQQLRSC